MYVHTNIYIHMHTTLLIKLKHVKSVDSIKAWLYSFFFYFMALVTMTLKCAARITKNRLQN